MKNNFKNYYNETLSNLDLESESDLLSDSIGLDKDRVENMKNKFIDFIKENNKTADTRSQMWAGVLYHLEPESLMEVFLLGTMMGAFEYSQSSNDDSKKLLLLSHYTLTMALEDAKKQNDWDFALQVTNEFQKLLKDTL
jgi:hypothetical protein